MIYIPASRVSFPRNGSLVRRASLQGKGTPMSMLACGDPGRNSRRSRCGGGVAGEVRPGLHRENESESKRVGVSGWKLGSRLDHRTAPHRCEARFVERTALDSNPILFTPCCDRTDGATRAQRSSVGRLGCSVGHKSRAA